MNRRQQSQLEDLGRAFQEALSDIINLDHNGSEPTPMMGAFVEEDVRCEVEPQQAISINISPYPVTIRQQHNGFIVEVGCQTFVFETYDKMSKYVNMYFEDPSGMTKKHEEGTLFK